MACDMNVSLRQHVGWTSKLFELIWMRSKIVDQILEKTNERGFLPGKFQSTAEGLDSLLEIARQATTTVSQAERNISTCSSIDNL